MTEEEAQAIREAAHAAVGRDIAAGRTYRVTASEASWIVPLLRGNRETSAKKKGAKPAA